MLDVNKVHVLEDRELDSIRLELLSQGFMTTDKCGWGRTWEKGNHAAFVSATRSGFAAVIFKKDPILELNCVRIER